MHKCFVPEALLEVDVVDLLLDCVKHFELGGSHSSDFLDLLFEVKQELVGDEILHVQLIDNDFNPGSRFALLLPWLLTELEHEASNRKLASTFLIERSRQEYKASNGSLEFLNAYARRVFFMACKSAGFIGSVVIHQKVDLGRAHLFDYVFSI